MKIVSLDGNAYEAINAECRMLEKLDSKYIIKYFVSLNKKTEVWVRRLAAPPPRLRSPLTIAADRL